MAPSDDFSDNGFRRGFQKEVSGEGWAVILRDDDFNHMRQVMRALRVSAGLTREVAEEVVWQVCDRGWAVVTITTAKEAGRIVEALQCDRMQAELLLC